MTEDERERKVAIYEALTKIRDSVLVIDGPYTATSNALRAIDAAINDLVDDKVIGPCFGDCGTALFESEMDDLCNVDGLGWVCRDCIDRWNREQAIERLNTIHNIHPGSVLNAPDGVLADLKEHGGETD